MAKGYRTKRDVSFPKVVARTGDGDEDVVTEGVNYRAGSLVHHDSLPPRIQKKAEEGGYEHLLDPIDDSDYDQATRVDEQQGNETGIFIAEHEAEAHALRMHGHVVVPKSQTLEVLAQGEQHAAQYQQAVKEHGLDRRPAQEAMAAAESDEGRVPEQFLGGMETRTGLPHDRGPEQREGDEDDGDDDYEDSDESQESEMAARPRPGQPQGEQPVADPHMTGEQPQQ